MDNVNLFLVHAIQLERDAARRFDDLMHSMQNAGNSDLERLFGRLGELSRLHLSAAMARGGFRELPQLASADFQWPDGITPEAAEWRGVDSMLDVAGALQLALEGEKTGHAWYTAVAKSSTDPEVLAMAREFAEEEAQHVSELERWIARNARREQS
jgi:hypothetical protein